MMMMMQSPTVSWFKPCRWLGARFWWFVFFFLCANYVYRWPGFRSMLQQCNNSGRVVAVLFRYLMWCGCLSCIVATHVCSFVICLIVLNWWNVSWALFLSAWHPTLLDCCSRHSSPPMNQLRALLMEVCIQQAKALVWQNPTRREHGVRAHFWIWRSEQPEKLLSGKDSCVLLARCLHAIFK